MGEPIVSDRLSVIGPPVLVKPDTGSMVKDPSASIAPGEGTTLRWSDIHYTIKKVDPKTKEVEEKVLLHTMSGNALPGELFAILGTSGAGKSTLLDVLSGRLVSNDLKGMLMTNGHPVTNKGAYRKMTGYVMQSDALFPLLTVRETMRFAAYLRVQNKTRAEKDEIAEQTIALLKLENAATTIIGDENNRGLSGGQKRRVSIGE